MGYQVLARKYRPQRCADVAGQDHVTRTLLNALEQNRIAHGYIFSGHRGIGKTTIARILAMALNCRSEVGSAERPTHEPCLQCVSCREIGSGGNPEAGELATQSFDFIEIDAASNRGIDDVRSIRQQASVQPARDKFKVFLLDEAHQITDAAFNAILKTLEEPPEWTIFMMATTEPENIPQTIRSRCQHFSFHAVKLDDIVAQLRMIAEKEQLQAEDSALALLAEAGDGSMRDALSIMDQAIASAPCNDAGKAVLTAALIRDLMGSVPNAVFERLMEAVAAGQSAELMEQANVLLNAGHSPSSLARQMVRFLRNALMAKLGGEQTELLQISADERARANRTAMLFSEEDLTRSLQIMLRTFDDLNYRQEQRFHLELGLLKLVHAQRLLPLEEFLSTVAAGAPARTAAAPAAPRAESMPRATAPAPVVKAAPNLSPFGSSAAAFGGSSAGSGNAAAAQTVSAPARVAPEAPAAPELPSSSGSVAPAQELAAAPAFAVTPLPATTMAANEADEAEVPSRAAESAIATAEMPAVDELRQAIVQALADAGHQSAGHLLGSGSWAVDGANLRIEVAGMGKKMLSLTVNAAVEKVIRQELQRLGGPSRFMVTSGSGTASTSTSTAPAPMAGSIQQEALNHPLVQRAREIFKAEVRSVVDLRAK